MNFYQRLAFGYLGRKRLSQLLVQLLCVLLQFFQRGIGQLKCLKQTFVQFNLHPRGQPKLKLEGVKRVLKALFGGQQSNSSVLNILENLIELNLRYLPTSQPFAELLKVDLQALQVSLLVSFGLDLSQQAQIGGHGVPIKRTPKASKVSYVV